MNRLGNTRNYLDQERSDEVLMASSIVVMLLTIPVLILSAFLLIVIF